MAIIKWLDGVKEAYNYFYAEYPEYRDLMDARLDSLMDWPPKKFFDIRYRDKEDGGVCFQTDTDQFVVFDGRYVEPLRVGQEGVVWLTHFELRGKVIKKGSDSHGTNRP